MAVASVKDRTRVCGTCGSGQLKFLVHSDRWSVDIGRCPECHMVAVFEPQGQGPDPELVPGRDDWPEYVASLRGDDELRIAVLDHLRSLVRTPAEGKPILFDVGAGVGDFVALAAGHGFDGQGNDLSARGIAMAQERNGVALSPLVLGEQPPASVDVITMWCVLAHVADPKEFLEEAFAMLRPGGILFLRTPGYCLMDRVGLTAARLSGGRASHIADRRINTADMHIFNSKNLTGLMEGIGYTEVDAKPTCHFPAKTEWYLEQVGGAPKLLLSPFAKVLDKMIERDLMVRNTLMVYARRPG